MESMSLMASPDLLVCFISDGINEIMRKHVGLAVLIFEFSCVDIVDINVKYTNNLKVRWCNQIYYLQAVCILPMRAL